MQPPQVSKGYSYPNDSVPVSKFMNPAILTLGFGLDYKPDKFTSFNFSPLSYKATFVPDTADIDQTKYGVAADKENNPVMGEGGVQKKTARIQFKELLGLSFVFRF
jgi:hypothetical protein